MITYRLSIDTKIDDLGWPQISKDHVTFAGSAIWPSSTVRDLGIMLDSKLSFGPHISQLVSRCFPQLFWINSCVLDMMINIRKAVVNSFIISRVDYCNSLLARVPHYELDWLQSVLEYSSTINSRHQEARHRQACVVSTSTGFPSHSTSSSCVCGHIRRHSGWHCRFGTLAPARLLWQIPIQGLESTVGAHTSTGDS